MLLEEMNDVQVVIEKVVDKNKGISCIVSGEDTIYLFTRTSNHFDLKNIKIISKEMLQDLKKYELMVEVEDYLIKLVSKKPYNEKQLIERGVKKFKNFEATKNAINDMKINKIFSEKEYVENYLDYFKNNFFGKRYIIDYLRNHGVEESEIIDIKFDEDDEYNKAWSYFELIKNKFVGNSIGKQKRKIYEELLKRGFENNIIKDIVDHLEVDEEKEKADIKKAILKLKNRYSNIEKDYMLENKIIKQLINLGYTYDNIISVMNEIKGD